MAPQQNAVLLWMRRWGYEMIQESFMATRRPDLVQIKDLVFRLLEEVADVPPARLLDNATLDSELRIGSIAFVELQVELEERLDVEIDPLVVLDLNRLDLIIEYIADLVRSRAVA